MGFHVEINSILRTDEKYEPLERGREFLFEKTGSRIFFDDIAIWLAGNDWTARAEVRVVEQTRTATSVRGRFRVLHAYASDEAEPLTRALRRMFAGGTSPFIWLLMSPADCDSAIKAGTWDRRVKGEEFIHASPADQLTRVANKHYTKLNEVRVVPLRAEKILSRIEWEQASDGKLYPHVYGPINFDAAEKPLSFRKDAENRFEIVIPAGQTT